MRDTLHERIIDRACRNDGWQRKGWKAAFRAKLRAEPDLYEDEEILDIIADVRHVPDAWRIVVEGPDTPGAEWGYPVLVLEFLEIEIMHPMPLAKRREYTQLWWCFDATDSFHFRVYTADRYSAIKRWLDEDTIYQETQLHM